MLYVYLTNLGKSFGVFGLTTYLVIIKIMELYSVLVTVMLAIFIGA
jgi:hypothetical protein